jgi:nucleoside-diphosphate-sugar epimerase
MLRKLSILLLCISAEAYTSPMASLITRRDSLHLISGATIGQMLHKEPPICVIGASGQSGTECVKLLAKQHKPVRAVSRQFMNPANLQDLDAVSLSYIQDLNVDIKNPSAIDSIIKGTSSVIFLANAKKYNRYVKSDTEEFQNYEDIDIYALENIVKACIKYEIPRLVYVSASCRSCLADLTLDIDKMSSIKCENCISKQSGENIIRKHYSTSKGPSYTIIRIGYLISAMYSGNEDMTRGVKDLEINQDYTKSGMISKYDLANVCINAAKSPLTAATTFEAYYRDTTQPYDVKDSLNRCTNLGKSMEECFFGSSFKNGKPKDLEEARKTPIKGSIFTTGCESSGQTWNELFGNLKKD